jgi:ribose 1,5-bisphosphokinase
VSETPTIARRDPVRIGPGRLILIVGPSGAGKDTLLDLARAACAGDPNIVFPRRVVTRAASAAEDNAHLGEEAFAEALAEGAFAIHWEAHGHRYALPRRVEDEIRAGRTVVVNVSRTVVDVLRQSYAEVITVSVTAPPGILAERLAARSRGSDGAVALRLGRSVEEIETPDIVIVNVGDVAPHAQTLVRVVRGEQER